MQKRRDNYAVIDSCAKGQLYRQLQQYITAVNIYAA